MSTKAKSETGQLIDSAGGLRGEPVGREPAFTAALLDPDL